MPLDAIFLSALVPELDATLRGMRVDKVRQPERDMLVLHLRGDVSRKLLLSAGRSDARLHLTDAELENPAAPPMFCMLLRKHLTGARILSLTQPEYERCAVLTFAAPTAMGEPEEKKLILELMGRGANLILTDGEGLILDCVYRADAESSERPVLPGLRYRMPPIPPRKSAMTQTRDMWLAAAATAPGGMPLEKWLVTNYLALSPLICREISYRAYADVDVTADAARRIDGGAKFAACASDLTERARRGEFTPCLLVDSNGVPRDFSYTEITQYENALTPERADDLSALLDAFFTRKSAEARAKTRAAELTRSVRSAGERGARRVSSQREFLAEKAERAYVRECGELIIANLHTLKQGMPELAAEDYYRGGTRIIPLNTQKTPQANAAKYFKDYTKAKRAEQSLSEQLAKGEAELEYLASVLSELALAETERELGDIRRELTDSGYVKRPKTREKVKPQAPRRFTARSGAEILVGRDNTQNDALTFRQAFKTDVWLHVKARHGSHVILRANGKTPDEADVLDAARLAAYYSEARGDGRAAVDHCLVKYVKKPPGAKPGMVIYTDYKTVSAVPGIPNEADL
ncbi:MAG: NFACT family protein [Oscillospiraceae bacterium]|jgi:predicted ribosome quality control (RQC) complex YloA/Tae2 family protein|nr:NFACT family protein [Oscillospiraceae bacterium]